MKPKLEAMLGNYPKIKAFYIDVDKSLKLAVSYEIFTIPALILLIDGKPTIKEARHISIDEFDSKIDRYYKMLFD